MKKGKFTEHQIVSAIKKQEAGVLVKDIAREMDVNSGEPCSGMRGYHKS